MNRRGFLKGLGLALVAAPAAVKAASDHIAEPDKKLEPSLEERYPVIRYSLRDEDQNQADPDWQAIRDRLRAYPSGRHSDPSLEGVGWIPNQILPSSAAWQISWSQAARFSLQGLTNGDA